MTESINFGHFHGYFGHVQPFMFDGVMFQSSSIGHVCRCNRFSVISIRSNYLASFLCFSLRHYHKDIAMATDMDVDMDTAMVHSHDHGHSQSQCQGHGHSKKCTKMH